jgi:hypothetical protein
MHPALSTQLAQVHVRELARQAGRRRTHARRRRLLVRTGR